MEKRNIQIDIETARKWYNGNDNTLRELALQAYKEEELRVLNYYYILESSTAISYSFPIICKQMNKWSALHKLAIIAEYLNEGWKPDWNNTNERKYYIFKNEECENISYCTIWNNGIPVFKSTELAEKAIEIMGEEINYIFD